MARPQVGLPSLALGLNLAATKSQNASSFDYEAAMQTQERPVSMRLVLTDGRVFQARFRAGDTVAAVKKYLTDYHEIPYEDITIKMGNQVLFDPLSLNDFPDLVSGKESSLQVEVKAPQLDEAETLLQSVMQDNPPIIPTKTVISQKQSPLTQKQANPQASYQVASEKTEDEPAQPRNREFDMTDEWAVKTYKMSNSPSKSKGKSKYEVQDVAPPRKSRACVLL